MNRLTEYTDKLYGVNEAKDLTSEQKAAQDELDQLNSEMKSKIKAAKKDGSGKGIIADMEKDYEKKIKKAENEKNLVDAEAELKKIQKEYEQDKADADGDEKKLKKLKDKYDKKKADAEKRVDAAKKAVSGETSTDSKSDDSKDSKQDDSKKTAKKSFEDFDEDDILDNKDINKNGTTKEDVNKFREKLDQEGYNKDLNKCLEDMPLGIIAVCAVFCPPAAIGLAGLTLVPGILNTVMTSLAVLKDAKDSISGTCSNIANGVKGAFNKVKNKFTDSDDADLQEIAKGIEEVNNASFDESGKLKKADDIKDSIKDEAIKDTTENIEGLVEKKITPEIAEARQEVINLKKEKKMKLAEASDSEKEAIEKEYGELIGKATEKFQAAQNGETLSDEEVTDKETGKKIKVTVHTGPRGGRYYYPKGAPKDNDHKRYVDESLYKSLYDYLRTSL